MPDDIRLKRKREGIEAQALRERSPHRHFFDRIIKTDGVWLIVECRRCSSRIQWHPVLPDTSLRGD